MVRERIYSWLFTPRDIASLVVYRVFFGLLMAHDALRYVLVGWVYSHYIEPPLTFQFVGFLWVKPLPAPLMYAVFGLMVGSGVALALGAYYRASATLYFLCHTYIFLVAAEYYLNHAYLISIIAFVMIFVPAHRAASVDVVRRPEIYSRQVHRWAYWLLLGTFCVVYVYGAVAKMNADWFAGEPIRHWMADRAATAPAWAAALLRDERVVQFVAYGGMLFDLIAPALLLYKPTRVLGICTSVAFHLTNDWLFDIGVFPWFMLASTTLFFEPDWPRRLPDIGARLSRYFDELGAPEEPAPDPLAVTPRKQRWVVGLMSLYFAYQLLVPLRHLLYPGDVAWNEEGHNFSWRMKLRNKFGDYTLRVVDKQTGEQWTVDPRSQLGDRQYRKSNGRPDMLLQYVHYLRDAYRRDYGKDVAIYADIEVSLNYRAPQRFVDPEVDLAAEPIGFGHYDWVLPFEDTPLPVPVPPVERHLGPVAHRMSVAARMRGSNVIRRKAASQATR